jgi:hypothetical protein
LSQTAQLNVDGGGGSQGGEGGEGGGGGRGSGGADAGALKSINKTLNTNKTLNSSEDAACTASLNTLEWTLESLKRSSYSAHTSEFVSALDDAAAEWWDTCYLAARAAQVLNLLLNLFTCFYRYQSTNTDAAARRNSIYEHYWHKSTNADAGPQFTCFTSTNAQILTQQQGQRAGVREHTAAAVGGSSSGVTPAATIGGTGKEKKSSREGQVVQGADISENQGGVGKKEKRERKEEKEKEGACGSIIARELERRHTASTLPPVLASPHLGAGQQEGKEQELTPHTDSSRRRGTDEWLSNNRALCHALGGGGGGKDPAPPTTWATWQTRTRKQGKL